MFKIWVISWHVRFKHSKATSKGILTLGRGGTVVASFLWTFVLKASSTAFPKLCVFSIWADSSKHNCQGGFGMVVYELYCFTSSETPRNRASRWESRSLRAVCMPLSHRPLSSFALRICKEFSISSQISSEDIDSRSDRLYVDVTKSSSYMQ